MFGKDSTKYLKLQLTSPCFVHFQTVLAELNQIGLEIFIMIYYLWKIMEAWKSTNQFSKWRWIFLQIIINLKYLLTTEHMLNNTKQLENGNKPVGMRNLISMIN